MKKPISLRFQSRSATLGGTRSRVSRTALFLLSALVVFVTVPQSARGQCPLVSNSVFDDWTAGGLVDCSFENLIGFDLSGDVISSSESPADLFGAILANAILTDAYLGFADLTDAILTGAILIDADLTGADLEDADFTGANITGANFSGATLTGTIFTGAFIEVNTSADQLDTPAGLAVSLREAIRDAPPGVTIRFAAALNGLTINRGPGLGELVIDKNLTIDASALSEGITISGENVTGPAGRVGQWDFKNSTDIGKATIGPDLAIVGTPPTHSSSLMDDSGSSLAGVITTVVGGGNHLSLIHGIDPTASPGAKVNSYTLVVDVFSPVAGRNQWRTIYATPASAPFANGYYIAGSSLNWLGASKISYAGAIDQTQWKRLVISVENGTSYKTYLDGVPFFDHITQPIDDAHYALESILLLFADNGGNNFPLSVGMVALYDSALNDAEVAVLGGPGDDSRVFAITAGNTVTMRHLTISGGKGAPTAAVPSVHGGGIYNFGTLTLDRVTVTGCCASWGGGVYNDQGTLDIVDSTISDNVSPLTGAGLVNIFGTVTLTNTTVSGNDAGASGGGLANYSTGAEMTLTHATIADNSAGSGGGGIWHVGATATLNLENTVVAGNTAPTGPDVDNVTSPGTINQFGRNFLGDPAESSLAAGPTLLTGDPLLAPLAFYGGSTLTRPPLPGSPAIESAVVLGGTPATDQRGLARPWGPLPDIGAVEFDPLTVAAAFAPLVSNDGDLIPDALEGPGNAYPHLSPGADNGGLDSDGDGDSDAAEIRNGTDPLDAASSLRITAFVTGTGFDPDTNPVFDVTFTSVPGLTYGLECTATLDFTPPEANLPAGLATGSETTRTITLSPGADFTRVRPGPPGMVLIPAGDFMMGRQSGSGQADELPVHTVTVSAFYLDQFEVTKQLWDEVGTWGASNGYTDLPAGGAQGPFHPVQDINWYAMVKWCNARSEMEGLTPAYHTDATQTTVYRTGSIDLANTFVKWDANGYRLPTEAEWEKAARGTLVGNTYPWGNVISGSDANYSGSGDPFEGRFLPSTPVGYYDGGQTPAGPNRANEYGLYDMAGNVFEWCWDWYDSGYYGPPAPPSTDPRGPVSSPFDARVLRGGSWNNSFTSGLRCANRSDDPPVFGSFSVGFRSARGL